MSDRVLIRCEKRQNVPSKGNFCRYVTKMKKKTKKNEEWGMGNGEWGMGYGVWGMENGEWGMGNKEWGMRLG